MHKIWDEQSKAGEEKPTFSDSLNAMRQQAGV